MTQSKGTRRAQEKGKGAGKGAEPATIAARRRALDRFGRDIEAKLLARLVQAARAGREAGLGVSTEKATSHDARGVARWAATLMYQDAPVEIEKMRATVGRELGDRDYVEITLMVPDRIDLDCTEDLYRRVVIGRGIAEALVCKIDAACSELDPDGRSVGYGTPCPEPAAEEVGARQDDPAKEGVSA